MDEEDHVTGMKTDGGMILFIHSGASYLSVAKARSRASGVYFLSDFKLYNITFNKYTPVLNGFIFVL